MNDNLDTNTPDRKVSLLDKKPDELTTRDQLKIGAVTALLLTAIPVTIGAIGAGAQILAEKSKARKLAKQREMESNQIIEATATVADEA